MKSAPDMIATARKAISCEIDGLNQLAESLDDNFGKAVDAIFALKGKTGNGRLILSGIGKSGHVANKIAATMASTGTPAFFVNPNEASHGDLGMITEQDVVLLLSNSGENSELADIIAYTQRFGITLIGITSKPESSLGKHADIPLIIPRAKEACGIGMAPTTSTTIMIALGDALAVTLLERYGLTREDFSIFHPGGKLGQKLKKVEELMLKTGEFPCVSKDKSMDDVVVAMVENNAGSCVIANDKNEVLGIITDGDIKRVIGPSMGKLTAENVMSADPKTISPDVLAAEGLDTMLNRFASPITSLVVTDENQKIVGMLRIQECLKAGLA